MHNTWTRHRGEPLRVLDAPRGHVWEWPRLKSVLAAHPVAGYVVLAYVFTWVAALPLVASGLGLIEQDIPRLWHGMAAAGPIGAAFLVRRAMNPTTSLWDLFRRTPRTPVSVWIWGFVALPVVILAVVLGGMRVADGVWPSFEVLGGALRRPEWVANLLVASVLFGFGEEPGWRGFLLPRLQSARSAAWATVVLAVIWAGWHAPFFAYRYEFHGVGAYAGFFVAMLAGAFWLTFLFNSTGGSVLAVAVWHVLWNIVNVGGAEVSVRLVTGMNVVMMAVGFSVLAFGGWRRLSLQGIVTAIPVGAPRSTPLP